MIVHENPGAAAELIRRANAHQARLNPREDGLHVSDLIYCRRKAWYRRLARARGLPAEEYDTDTLAMFLLGHGYHALLEQGEDERKVRLILPGPANQIALVHGTVDHVERTHGQPDIPHEFKTTRASSAKPIESVQHYIEQVAAYCVAMGVTQGRLSVVYINGAYNRGGAGMKPTIKTFDLEFTPEELAAWWRELGRRAHLILAPTMPPLAEHRTWECRYCPLAFKAGGDCPGGPGDERHWFMLDTLPQFVEEVLDAAG